MEDIELRISRYANVPTKDLKSETIRLENILNEERQKECPNEEKIAKILSNLEFLKTKKKYNGNEVVRSTLDKVIRWSLWAVLVVYCLTLFILPIWMLMTSVKDPLEYATNSFGLPKSFHFENFANVFQKLKVEVSPGNFYYVWNLALVSLIYSFSATLLSVALTTMMAYVLSKYRFFGSRFIYTLGIIIMIVPIIGSGPSAMTIKRMLHIYDNMALFILTGPAACFSGLNFLLLYGAFKSLPWDYAEAVFVDGGGHYSAFFKMYLPMALPTMTVIFVLGFLGSWNDYSTFMIWLPSTPNLAYGMYLFQGKTKALYKTSITEIMAGFTMVIIPTVTLYLSSQKLILSKFTVGGLKG